MRVAAVSGDLLVKLALGAAVIGALVYVTKKGLSLVPDHVPDAINPLSENNAAYSSVNALGHAIATAPDAAGKNADGSWTAGGFLFDVFNPGTAAAVRALSGPVAPPAAPLYPTAADAPGAWG